MAQQTMPICSFRNGAVSVAIVYDDVTLVASALACTGDGTRIWVQYSDPAHGITLSHIFTVPTETFALPAVPLTAGARHAPVSIPDFAARCPA